MVEDRGGKVGAMDERYCIDNGAMIAYAGIWNNEIYNKYSEAFCNSKQVVRLRLTKQHSPKDLEQMKYLSLGEMIE